jgi:hypothetical protein
MSDFLLVLAADVFPGGFFVSGRRYRLTCANRKGIVVLLPGQKPAAEKSCGGNSAKIAPRAAIYPRKGRWKWR